MTNYFVSYDLNNQRPTHAEMDAHLKKLGDGTLRVLETVWYVRTFKGLDDLYNYVASILREDDGLIVIEASDVKFDRLLCGDQRLQGAWEDARLAGIRSI